MSLVSVLGESAVRSLALALAAALALRLLRVEHARLAKRAWTAVLLLSLAMPLLVALGIPSFSLPPLWSTPRLVLRRAAPQDSIPASTPARAAPLRRVRDHSSTRNFAAGASAFMTEAAIASRPTPPTLVLRTPVPAALQGRPTPPHWPALWRIGFAVYLAISSLLLLRMLLGLALAARLWHRAQPFAASATAYPVRLSVDLRSPATLGRGILLPLEALEWDDAALTATLAHEVEHIREGDFHLQLAATLYHCFFWISPHAWWLRPELSRLSELVCDRAAVRASGDGLSYAQLLVRFATAEQTPAGLVAMAQSAGLRERVERLIADPELVGAFRRRRGQGIAAACLLAVAATAAAASIHSAQPQILMFTAPPAPAPPAVSTPQTKLSPAPPASPANVPPASRQFFGASRLLFLQPNPLPAKAPQTFRVLSPLPPGPLAFAVQPQLPRPFLLLQADPAQQNSDPSAHSFAIYSSDGESHFVTNGWMGDDATFATEAKKHPQGVILFQRDGKLWCIDDPALVKQAEEAYAPVRELGKQQGELGRQQGALGRQQGEIGALEGKLGALQGEMGREQGSVGSMPFTMPQGFDQTLHDYVEAQTKLALEQDKMSDKERAEWETRQQAARLRFDQAMQSWKAQQPDRDAWEKQMRDQAEQIRKQLEPLIQQTHQMAEKQRDLGHQQADLGHQQALLGHEQREASQKAQQQLQSLIDQAVKDGKARPVQ